MSISRKSELNLRDKPGKPGALKKGLVAAGAVALALALGACSRQEAAKNGPPSGGRSGGIAPAPVNAATVATSNMPIYLTGIGNVQAFNTATIRTRVDGQLQKIVFTEGQEVHAGDLLAQIDPDPFRTQMEQSLAKKGQDEAQLANARVDLQRYADLLKTEGVTQQVYDTQKAMVNQLEALVKADQAAVENIKVQLAYATITSPIDGRVGIRQVDQGNIVRASDANGLVVITQLKPISVVFTLPSQALPKLQAQMARSGGDFTVLAMDDDDANVLSEGKLAVIDNQIDTSTLTIKIKATFTNSDLRLWPGQFVNVRLLLTVRTNAVVVPSQVVQRGPDGPMASFAFVVKEDQTVEMRPVKVAFIDRGEAVIDEGLQPGEVVVTDGQFKLQNGSQVRVSGAPGGGRSGGPGTPGPGARRGQDGPRRGGGPGPGDNGAPRPEKANP